MLALTEERNRIEEERNRIEEERNRIEEKKLEVMSRAGENLQVIADFMRSRQPAAEQEQVVWI